MGSIQEIFQNLRLKSLSSSTQASQVTKSESIIYKCSVCKDTEIIYNPESNSAHECECVVPKRYLRMLERSGISEAFQKKTLENFETKGKPSIILRAKEIALRYIQNFSDRKFNNSLLMMGSPGSGKTHLCIAVSNELIKMGIGVLYMPYREIMPRLKQVVTDEETYQKEINKYKLAPVLFIDDLYKGSVTKSDLNISFEIINYRYLKSLPIIVSTEFLTTNLLEFDEATGSRIIEISKDYMVELVGKNLNYRL